MVFIIVTIIAFLFFIASTFISNNTSHLCKNILDSQNMADIVSSIGYGRVYPYYTSMSIGEVRKIIVRNNKGISEFENSVKFNKITGGFGAIILPSPKYKDINTVKAQLTKNEVISAITIELNNEHAKWEAYMLLTQKFGKPLTDSSEFAIWRDRYMVINLDYHNISINVIDERLLGF